MKSLYEAFIENYQLKLTDVAETAQNQCGSLDKSIRKFEEELRSHHKVLIDIVDSLETRKAFKIDIVRVWGTKKGEEFCDVKKDHFGVEGVKETFPGSPATTAELTPQWEQNPLVFFENVVQGLLDSHKTIRSFFETLITKMEDTGITILQKLNPDCAALLYFAEKSSKNHFDEQLKSFTKKYIDLAEQLIEESRKEGDILAQHQTTMMGLVTSSRSSNDTPLELAVIKYSQILGSANASLSHLTTQINGCIAHSSSLDKTWNLYLRISKFSDQEDKVKKKRSKLDKEEIDNLKKIAELKQTLETHQSNESSLRQILTAALRQTVTTEEELKISNAIKDQHSRLHTKSGLCDLKDNATKIKRVALEIKTIRSKFLDVTNNFREEKDQYNDTFEVIKKKILRACKTHDEELTGLVTMRNRRTTQFADELERVKRFFQEKSDKLNEAISSNEMGPQTITTELEYVEEHQQAPMPAWSPTSGFYNWMDK